jgi:hypothetical protein
MLRKQITYITIYRPKNVEEWNSIASELFNMNKEDALKIFNYVFDAPYNHIDVDLVESKYYKNFKPLSMLREMLLSLLHLIIKIQFPYHRHRLNPVTNCLYEHCQ